MKNRLGKSIRIAFLVIWIVSVGAICQNKIIISGERDDQSQPGSLKIQSIPEEIHIAIARLEISSDKAKREWIAEGIPAGQYQVTFSTGNRSISYDLEIRGGDTTHLFVDIPKGLIENRSKTRIKIIQREQNQEIDEQRDPNILVDTRDGKEYKTVKIGNQVWLAENLNYAVSGSACYDNIEANCQIYGRLYNWSAAINACPQGFHLPSKADIDELIFSQGGKKKASRELRSSSGWYKNRNGTNSSEFNALPAGFRLYGDSQNIGKVAIFWTSSEYRVFLQGARAYAYGLPSNQEPIRDFTPYQSEQYPVRCVAND